MGLPTHERTDPANFIRIAPDGYGASVHELRDGEGRVVVPPSVLADPARWRTNAGPVGVGLVVSARAGRLRLRVDAGRLPFGQDVDTRAYVVDAFGEVIEDHEGTAMGRPGERSRR